MGRLEWRRIAARLRLFWHDGDLDRSVWSEIVAISSMTLGVPVPNASPYLAQEIKAALVGEVSEVANQVCNGMLVARITMLLQSCNRVGGPGDVSGFIDHAHNPQPECKPRPEGCEANGKSLD